MIQKPIGKVESTSSNEQPIIVNSVTLMPVFVKVIEHFSDSVIIEYIHYDVVSVIFANDLNIPEPVLVEGFSRACYPDPVLKVSSETWRQMVTSRGSRWRTRHQRGQKPELRSRAGISANL